MYIIEGSRYVQKDCCKDFLLLPCFVYRLHQYHHCIFCVSSWTSAIVLWGKQLMFFCKVANDVCHDALHYLSQRVLQSDWAICFGFHIVRLSWFPEYNGCGMFERFWEVR